MRNVRHIGSCIAVKAALVGILIAYLMMTGLIASDKGLIAFLWLFEFHYWLNLLLGASGLVLMSYLFGRQAGIEIIERKRNYSIVGIKYGYAILITGTLIGSTLGFIQEGIDNLGTKDDPIEDYYFKPLFWVIIAGSIPVNLVGLWFGRKIRKEGLKLIETSNH